MVDRLFDAVDQPTDIRTGHRLITIVFQSNSDGLCARCKRSIRTDIHENTCIIRYRWIKLISTDIRHRISDVAINIYRNSSQGLTYAIQ